jgi:hypothetical protein
MEAQYGVRFIPGPRGQLLWKLACSPLQSKIAQSGGSADQRFSRFSKHSVIYDDHRSRRIIYEVDPERDLFRYVLERSRDDQDGGGAQRFVFPTLRAAVFCLVGCISRDE